MLSLYLSVIETQEDRDKFTELYHTYKNLMFYVANDILHNEHNAEDAVHDAFLRLMKYVDTLGEISNTKTKSLVVVVTESAAKDIYGKLKRQSIHEIDDSFSSDISEPYAFQEHNIKDICDCIKKLPDKYRDALLLHCVHGYKYSEISDLLNIQDATARKRVERGKLQLAQILQEQEMPV